MLTVIWKNGPVFYSKGDENYFFTWLTSISGVVGVEGFGGNLHIHFKTKRISKLALLELTGLYKRYIGDFTDLLVFESRSNTKIIRRYM